MVDEDRLFREYLMENGVDVSMMGITADQASDMERNSNDDDKPKRDIVSVVEKD